MWEWREDEKPQRIFEGSEKKCKAFAAERKLGYEDYDYNDSVIIWCEEDEIGIEDEWYG